MKGGTVDIHFYNTWFNNDYCYAYELELEPGGVVLRNWANWRPCALVSLSSCAAASSRGLPVVVVAAGAAAASSSSCLTPLLRPRLAKPALEPRPVPSLLLSRPSRFSMPSRRPPPTAGGGRSSSSPVLTAISAPPARRVLTWTRPSLLTEANCGLTSSFLPPSVSMSMVSTSRTFWKALREADVTSEARYWSFVTKPATPRRA